MVLRVFSSSRRVHSLFFRTIFFLLILISFFHPVSEAKQRGASPHILVLTIDGAIGPALASYITKGFAEAALQKASLIVIQMDTSGGLLLNRCSVIRNRRVCV